jgi:hypothetical protein
MRISRSSARRWRYDCRNCHFVCSENKKQLTFCSKNKGTVDEEGQEVDRERYSSPSYNEQVLSTKTEKNCTRYWTLWLSSLVQTERKYYPGASERNFFSYDEIIGKPQQLCGFDREIHISFHFQLISYPQCSLQYIKLLPCVNKSYRVW